VEEEVAGNLVEDVVAELRHHCRDAVGVEVGSSLDRTPCCSSTRWLGARSMKRNRFDIFVALRVSPLTTNSLLFPTLRIGD
jgi:hypothetical protein